MTVAEERKLFQIRNPIHSGGFAKLQPEEGGDTRERLRPFLFTSLIYDSSDDDNCKEDREERKDADRDYYWS